MNVVRRALSPRERRELVGITSLFIAVGRAVLYLSILALICIAARRLNRLTPSLMWWPFVAALIGIYLYRASRVLTGRAEFRGLIRQDIAADYVEDHAFEIETVITFPEVEDEGPVWCFPADEGTWCVSGQRLLNATKDGLPRTKLIVSMTPYAKRVLRLKTSGAHADALKSKVPFTDSPLVSAFKLSGPVVKLPVSWSVLVDSITG
jgi:hypothetical protein